jgi:prefoldin beta subunit
MAKISPQLQDQLVKLQQVQQQVELLVNQRMQLERESKEIDRAIAEIDQLESADAVVYKTIGAILIKADKDKVKEELTERKETLEMRVKTITRQEERAKSDYESKRKTLQTALQQSKMGDTGEEFPGPM